MSRIGAPSHTSWSCDPAHPEHLDSNFCETFTIPCIMDFSEWVLVCTLLTHHVVYHVDFHGATSHMGIHVVNRINSQKA